MARTLPENTVDAWTAIHLAGIGVPWIWLPTTNGGGTKAGSHPGDVSTVLGRRLVVIENKAIENNRRIRFGANGRDQKSFLTRVEEAGLVALRAASTSSTVPWLGWVLYGLPLMPGQVSGADWHAFPSRQYLACPHDLDESHVGATSIELHLLAEKLHRETCVDHRLAPPVEASRPWQPLRLDWIEAAAAAGLVGLPLGESSGAVRDMLRDLVVAARNGGWPQDSASNEIDIEDRDDLTILDLLAVFAGLARGTSTHTVVAVL